MFRSILKDDRQSLPELIPLFIQEQKFAEVIRCYFFIYSKRQELEELSISQMRVVLADLHTFGSRMRKILSTSTTEFAQTPRTRRLLGYEIHDTDQGQEVIIHPFSALKQSFNPKLKSQAGQMYPVIRELDSGEYIVTLEHVGEAAKTLLESHLMRVAYAHDNACQQAKAFRTLCDNYATGKCRNGPECRWLHVSPEQMRNHFNERFRIYLCQVMVINDMDIVLNPGEKKRIRTWVLLFGLWKLC